VRKTVESACSLLDALGELFPDTSRTTLRQMLHTDRVRVNGEVERKASRDLRKGDAIEVGPRQMLGHLDPRLQVVFEDDDLIAVSKATGLLTVASPGEQEETAQAFLDAYLAEKREGRIHVVHRLDRDTSGVLVFAKNFKTKEKLKALWNEHDIERLYVAIIEGVMLKESGKLESFLDEESPIKVKSVRGPGQGRLAVTHYKTVERGAKYSMVEVHLETGRRNQIRVQFSDTGHPIAGDRLYGARTDPIGRLALHAQQLGFVHPLSGKNVSFVVPVPDAFRKLAL
jgi:23S rRNA pseudouridine1911/1915/1917 synthase